MSFPYRSDQWWISPFNFMPETEQKTIATADIGFYDVTLRDGEQTPGVVFRPQDRLRVARALDAVGVQRIEAGFPLISDDDREGVAAVASAELKSEVWGFSRCLTSDVDVNRECGIQNLLMEIAISDIKLASYNLSRDKVKSRAIEAIIYAKDLGFRVAFMPVDLTRADFEFAREICSQVVHEAGADEFVIVDTLGVASPQAIAYLTKSFHEEFDVPIHVHCHNEFGLAVANSLAGIKEGAEWVHVTLCGLGEKAGNTDLCELSLALKLLYGTNVQLQFERLTEAARTIEDVSGYHPAPNKPVTGHDLFRRESGGVVQQLLTNPQAVEAYDPAIVGATREIVLGKKSGRYSITAKLESRGVDLSEEEIQLVLEKVKRLSIEEKGLIGEENFDEIIRSVSNRKKSEASDDQ